MKILKGFLQVIVFLAIYELSMWLIMYYGGMIIVYLSTFPILNIILSGFVLEGMLNTILPAGTAIFICYVMAKPFKKINIFSYIDMMCFVAYAVISTLIRYITSSGLFNWSTLNALWSNIIVIGIIGYVLFVLTGYKIEKKEGE